jgi:hypothetical protein
VIFRLRKMSEGPFRYARDGQEVVALGNELHALGGWSAVQNPITNSDHYRSVDGGRTWTRLPDAPWFRRHDFGAGVKDGKIRIWGGDGSKAPEFMRDCWTFDPSAGWVRNTADAGPVFGNRALFGRCVHQEWCYAIAGANCVDVIRSRDLVTWESLGKLPEDLEDLRSPAVTSFRGSLYVLGGKHFKGHFPGKVWKSSDDGRTWSVIGRHPRFETYWCNAAATAEAMFYLSGRNDAANQYGLYWSTDGVEWNPLVYNVPARHAAGLCATPDNDVVITCGNLWNDCWRVVRVDR